MPDDGRGLGWAMDNARPRPTFWDRLVQACAACSLQRPEVPLDDLELLLTWYVELAPTPELYGELLTQYLAAQDHDFPAGSQRPHGDWPSELQVR